MSAHVVPLPDDWQERLRATRLTERQRDVLTLAAEGLSYRQIGARLGIAKGTVRNHGDAIRASLHVFSLEHGVRVLTGDALPLWQPPPMFPDRRRRRS